MNIKIDNRGIKEMRQFAPNLRRQIPFAQSVALNQTAFKVQATIAKSTTRFFDKPKRFTQKAFKVQRSTKKNLKALVGPQSNRDYLAVQILGGDRPLKDAEKLILGRRSVGAWSEWKQLTPVKAGRTKAGDIKRSSLAKIKSGLSTTNQGSGIFIGTPRGKKNGRTRDHGVWVRKGRTYHPRGTRYVVKDGKRRAIKTEKGYWKGKLAPLFKKAEPATYKPGSFPVLRIGSDKARQTYLRMFNEALDRAMATAK